MRYREEDTGIVLIIAIWIMVLISIIMCSKLEAASFSIYILLGFGALMSLIYLPTYIKTKKIVNNYNEIKEKGQKALGEIVSYSSKVTGIGDHYTWHYTVTVKYNDPYTKQEKIYTTPDLNFNPIHTLGSKTCTVCVLNEHVYVTDFIKRQKEQENIWNPEYTDLEKKETKIIIIFIVLFLLVFFSIAFIGLKPLIFN